MVLAQEEESHLQKMLYTGVIEPSILESASPPVLIARGAERSDGVFITGN
jgi:hypothetical protein